MIPIKLLPYPAGHADEHAYVDALLDFITTSEMLQTLCGGVHILDFLTRESDLYQSVLPADWREWLRGREIVDVLDLLMREDLAELRSATEARAGSSDDLRWRGGPVPPPSLLEYISSVRSLSLDRSFHGPESRPRQGKVRPLSRQVAVGMKVKKIHEVENFAAFIHDLTSAISDVIGHRISHHIDFGSGQNYLGRALASPLYRKQIIAIENKQLNIDGAKSLDVLAKLAKKEIVWRNKKAFRAGQAHDAERVRLDRLALVQGSGEVPLDLRGSDVLQKESPYFPFSSDEGRMQYVEHVITNGDLQPVLDRYGPPVSGGKAQDGDDGEHKPVFPVVSDAADQHLRQASRSSVVEPSCKAEPRQFMVVSLHSCGNLVHHGLRSLLLNDSVQAVAMVGCCYNLVTERLGPATYKLPNLRGHNSRLEQTSSACDPHGFPMSERMASYRHKGGEGIRMNITARMMAVQAPLNWTVQDCDSFFTRHFYRALLQRVFVDQGVVEPPASADEAIGGSPAGSGGQGQPIIIGTLRKSCYTSFLAYVRGALAKLAEEAERGHSFRKCDERLTDDEIASYETRYRDKRHELCVVWSLMAFSAGLVESAIVVDRWLFLKEQEEVKECWVQTVFDYQRSPRNLVIVGIKA